MDWIVWCKNIPQNEPYQREKKKHAQWNKNKSTYRDPKPLFKKKKRNINILIFLIQWIPSLDLV